MSDREHTIVCVSVVLTNKFNEEFPELAIKFKTEGDVDDLIN